jgi:glycosyltransferase involved in cell wall biosynthesis
MVDLVSVIIPTVKGDPVVSRCIQAVKNQSYTNTEIVLVCEGYERSRQRNIGIDRAKGRYLLILDSDMLPHPGLIEDQRR